MKKGNNSDSSNSGEVIKQKERHIVSWSQQEDDILREQIRLHGTENWTIIASKFKDKTTRQCRRRWFTYLNSDFKKGGWSPEEDLLLCEAQKIFGNRWTEIAKVVSGRTDNAVKNRFTTLCKKRAKQEAAGKENSNTSFINLNNKRVEFPSGLLLDRGTESATPYKKLRTYIREKGEGVADNILRPPLAVLAQDVNSSQVNFPNQHHVGGAIKETSGNGSANDKTQGSFLKKDNPKVVALMQQAELLSSLATKINSEKTDQSLESAWMVLQDFLKQNKESDLLSCKDTDFQLEDLEKLMEDLKSSTGSSRSLREPGLYELSPASSEYSTGSTHMPKLRNDKTEGLQEQEQEKENENGLELELQSKPLKDQNSLIKRDVICQSVSKIKEKDGLTCNATKANDEVLCEHSNREFSSPLHVTPLFRSMAAEVPSPVFSESEKHFLMRTLGMESSPITITNPSQTPPCKKSLLHCL